jgi:DNA primase
MKQEILTKIDICDYIGKTVTLQQKGRDQYIGLCPFHNEKTPSFSVSSEKKFFHCFGCKASGDVIKFVMLYDNLDYEGALAKLANEAGIKVNGVVNFNPNKAYFNINRKFAEICHKLLKDKSHHYGIDYLIGRGLTYEIIDKFYLGYLPSNKSEELFKELLNEFSQGDIFKSGLFKLGIGNKPYCQFNGRIIFPIADGKNSIVGFGSRVINDQSQPKYLNSSESDFFHKSELLYGFDKLYRDKQLKELKTVFVVEGYIDVISLANGGITNAVGVLGANLSSDQLKKLWTITDRPTICFDNDVAGAAAMERIAKLAVKIIEPGKTISFLQINNCKDPDEFIKKYGPEHFIQYFNNSKLSLADYLYMCQVSDLKLQDPDEVVVLHQRLKKIYDEITNDLLRNEYKKHFNRLFYSSRTFKDEFKKKSSEQRENLCKLKLSQKYENDEEKICEIISKNSFILMNQEILDDLMTCKFKSNIAENMRLKLTRDVDKICGGERNYEVEKTVKRLIILLKIKNVQEEIVNLCKRDINTNVESQLLQLKQYEIQLKNKLSSTLI